MARAQQEIIWAKQNFSRMDGSLPNEGIQPSTEPLAKMCELQDTLSVREHARAVLFVEVLIEAKPGAPRTASGSRAAWSSSLSTTHMSTS